MPRLKKKSWVLLALALCLLLAACGGGKGSDNGNEKNANGEETKEPYRPTGDPNLEGKVTVWSILPDIFEAALPAFNERYPNIKVEIVNQGFEVMSRTLTAIAAGKGGPDIVHYGSAWHSDLVAQDGGMEDLLQPPYNAGRLRDAFVESSWNRGFTVDGKKLIALTQDTVPYTFSYRADIFEEYGFPSDPDEVAEYLADEDNYINMALTFLADDIYIMQQATTDLRLMPNYGFFDRDLNYIKNNETMIRFLDLLKKESQLGLIPNYWVPFSDDANQAVEAGKLIAIRNEATSGHYVRNYAPSTMGKWRMSRMPLNGNNADQGFMAGILSQSKNKEAAWALLEFVFATVDGQKAALEAGALGFPSFKPTWEMPEFINYEDEAYGGQRVYELGVKLLEEAPSQISTPFDRVAADIFNQGIEAAIASNEDSRAALQRIQQDTEAAISEEKKKFLEKTGN